MIRLENVNKYYRSGSERIHAIKNFHVTFPNRGLVFIIGPSGCGKSTLLNLLGGLDKADEGHFGLKTVPSILFPKRNSMII
jgi:ABC-type lipoprotein export system ATPase subunit